jgi:hypothetical protein
MSVVSSVFPWALGGPLALYLGLYVVTLAIHAVFVGYVLGGTGWCAVAAVRGRDDDAAAVARDWLPFALGAAITAGVAPLLFVQILYQERFYTSNLLLFNHWMAVVPVLIAGFYLLYLHKSDRVRRAWLRVAVPIAAALCFVFVAFSWTENHLLGLDDRAWIAFWTERRGFYDSPALAPRLLGWLAASLPIFAAGASWQVRARGGPPARALAIAALVGIAASTVAAWWQYTALPADSAYDLDQPMIAPWWWAFGAARACEAAAWLVVAIAPAAPRARRALASACAAGAISVVAGAMLREGARLHALGLLHPRAIAAGGALVFFLFAALTIAALVAIYRIVRRGLADGPTRTP